MADIPGLNRNIGAYSGGRTATGNTAISRLNNFLNANIGNTQKLSQQVQNALSGQGQKFEQDLNTFAHRSSSFDQNDFNKAALGLQNVAKLSNQLQTKEGLENVVSAATKSKNPYASKLDMELLLRDPTAISNIKSGVNDKFNYGFDRINQLLSGRGYQGLDKSIYGQKPITDLQSYYSDQQEETPEYYEEYEDGESFGSDVGSGSLKDIFNYYKKDASNPEKLNVIGSAVSTAFGGPAGAAVYNAIPEEIKNKILTKVDTGASKVMGKDYLNINQPVKAITSPIQSQLNFLSKAVPVAKPVQNAIGSIGSSIGGIFKKLCFAPSTLIKMANGEVKCIDDVCIGDVLLDGGEVYSVIRNSMHPEDFFYLYNNTLVTGSHAVKEDEKWIRVENSKKAIKTHFRSDYVVNLSTTNHMIISEDGTIFSDYDEINNSEHLSLDECLCLLNR